MGRIADCLDEEVVELEAESSVIAETAKLASCIDGADAVLGRSRIRAVVGSVTEMSAATRSGDIARAVQNYSFVDRVTGALDTEVDTISPLLEYYSHRGPRPSATHLNGTYVEQPT